PASVDVPPAATLVTIAVAGRLAAPVLRRSARAIRRSSGALRRALDRQYVRVSGRGSAGRVPAGQSTGTDRVPTGSAAGIDTDLAPGPDDLHAPASRTASI